MKRLILIDSHAIIHRAFHALPPLTSTAGDPVNAVYGFASILLKIIKELKPDYVVAAFDHAGPTFRHVAFERYKATRVKAPDALSGQIPMVKELVSAFGIPVIEKPGYEADDIIGTVAAQVHSKHPDIEVIVVTGDLDTLQLIDRATKVFTMRKGLSDTVLYDTAAVEARYGLHPRQLIDFKGLRGDPADNIPGVKGIGEKTALELLHSQGSIEELYRALKKGNLEARAAIIETLRKHEADALFSKTLATIDRNVPIKFVLAGARVRKSSAREKIQSLFEQLGFYSLLRRMDGSGGKMPAGSGSRPVPFPSSLGREPKAVRLSAVPTFAAVPRPRHALILAHPERGAVFVATGAGRVYELPIAVLGDAQTQAWFSRPAPIYAFDVKLLLRSHLPYDPKIVRDLTVLWWLLDPGRHGYSAEGLVRREFPSAEPRTPEEQAALLWQSCPVIEERLRTAELTTVYQEFEAPLIPILAAMEEHGIGFNPRPLSILARNMADELTALGKRIHAAAGAPFNINSPRELARVLFEELGLAATGLRKTEKLGVISTRESELAKLRHLHPVIADILRYREIAKLKSTYVDALPGAAGADGRIHTTWNQTGTATGRLSSQTPNLQNIPIRSEFGRGIRSAFVARRGFELVAFDYSQLELRIAADLASDEKMIAAFERGEDIHRMTAAEVNNLPLDKVRPELRARAKTLNFGVLYGMGARAFAETAGVTREEAQFFIEEYFRDFQGIARFVEETKEFARTHRFTKTAFGRKRFFPDFGQTNFRLQREAERQAVNHVIQGTEGDIMKKAMIGVDAAVAREGWRDNVRLLLQIHDELIFEISRKTQAASISEIQRIMEGVWAGRVKMQVEVKRGPNWGALEP